MFNINSGVFVVLFIWTKQTSDYNVKTIEVKSTASPSGNASASYGRTYTQTDRRKA